MSITKSEETNDVNIHRENIEQRLEDLTRHTREDIARVNEPRFQALLETTAEVLTGLRAAYQHYGEGQETAWRAPDKDYASPRSAG